MGEAKRIQRKRTKGWKMPPNTVSVTRPGKWGNPFIVDRDGDAAHCVHLFRLMLTQGPRPMPPPTRKQQSRYILHAKYCLWQLRGRDLACYCPLDQPCHADVLLELANTPASAD